MEDEIHVTSDEQLAEVFNTTSPNVSAWSTALLPGEIPPFSNPDATAEGDPVPRPAKKPNPYVDALARELLWDMLPSSGTTPLEVAQRIYDDLIVPKNKRIHDLDGQVKKLQAQKTRLGKVLARHNAGVCKDGEDPIDCASRMLSPVHDTTPKRDRP